MGFLSSLVLASFQVIGYRGIPEDLGRGGWGGIPDYRIFGVDGYMGSWSWKRTKAIARTESYLLFAPISDPMALMTLALGRGVVIGQKATKRMGRPRGRKPKPPRRRYIHSAKYDSAPGKILKECGGVPSFLELMKKAGHRRNLASIYRWRMKGEVPDSATKEVFRAAMHGGIDTRRFGVKPLEVTINADGSRKMRRNRDEDEDEDKYFGW